MSYTVLPGAQWRPLGDPAQTPAIVPRLLIFHTMVGYLTSTENMWRPTGYGGNFSTFGLGGPWDGAALDGVMYQWQSMYRMHAANWDSNTFSNSIETSDGGDPSRPWSPKQLTALIAATVAWCRETGQPARLATAWDGSGIGYHRQFPQWNHNSHQCPGSVREAQLINTIIPQAAAILAGRTPTATPTPTPPAPTGGLTVSEVSTLFYGDEGDGSGSQPSLLKLNLLLNDLLKREKDRDDALAALDEKLDELLAQSPVTP